MQDLACGRRSSDHTGEKSGKLESGKLYINQRRRARGVFAGWTDQEKRENLTSDKGEALGERGTSRDKESPNNAMTDLKKGRVKKEKTAYIRCREKKSLRR